MKRASGWLIGLVIVGVAATAGVFWFPQGRLTDAALSSALSRQCGLLVRLSGAGLHRYSEISFESLEVFSSSGRELVSVEKGRILFKNSVFFGNRALLEATRFKIRTGFLQGGWDAWIPSLGIDANTSWIQMDQARILFQKKGADSFIRILRLSSHLFTLKGGFRLHRRTPTKAHALVVLPEEVLKKLPKEISARAIRRRPTHGEFKLTYSNNLLKVKGLHGPLFVAKWQA